MIIERRPRGLPLDRWVMMLAKGGAFAPGMVTVLDIYHDDECAIWRGGMCDCEATLRLPAPLVWRKRREWRVDRASMGGEGGE